MAWWACPPWPRNFPEGNLRLTIPLIGTRHRRGPITIHSRRPAGPRVESFPGARRTPRKPSLRKSPDRRAQENRKTSRRFFFFSRRKWAGGTRILQGGGAAVSPASACGAQASPAARYPTPSGRALGLLLRCRQWRCGQGLRSLCLAECLRVPMPHGCTERRWAGPDQL